MIATQNPHEQHGTYPLPEAQLDRFAMKLEVGYPRPADERAMLAAAIGPPAEGRETLPPVLTPAQLAAIQTDVAAVGVAPAVQEYLVNLARASRSHRDIALGVSPRGLLLWQRTAQARAWLDSRRFVTPDDVQQVATPVLAVRLGLESGDAGGVISNLLESVEVP